MNIYEFMSNNPILTFFICFLITEMIVRIAYGLPNRILRHWNIRKHGLPPQHCNADGDFEQADD